MKRELKALSLITLVLAVLTAGLLLLQGGSLTVYEAYPQPISAGEITVETDEAFVKLVSVRVLFGNGAGEPVAEAEAMAAYLRSRGIPEERILIEDRSGTTRENLRNSRALAEAADREGKAALSTSDYHVFRSGILAAGEGWRVEGMGSRTKWYFWPNAQIREFAGLLRENLRGIIAFFLVIALESLLVAGLL